MLALACLSDVALENFCFHCRHWLTDAYILFATPYFAYDIYAMFLCHWHKLQVKGHEEGGAGPTGAAAVGFLRREMLMVLHHIFMVTFCFPASVVTMTTHIVYNESVTKKRFICQFELPA